MDIDTFSNHQKAPELASDNHALVPPIYQSVKFTFDKMSQMKELFEGKRPGYFYSRFKNPTVDQLEQLLAKAQGTEMGIATSSGVAAISSCLFSLLKSGDKIVYFIESYKPTRILIEKILAKFGVEGIKLSLDDLDQMESAFQDQDCRYVIWESPTNPQVKIPQNQRIIELAKKHGVRTILDNTFAGFHKNRELDIDIYIHSLSKYASGHGDVMGGVILSRKQIIDEMFHDTVEIGSCLDPHAAYLILRGMRTYQLRYDKQAASAQTVAQWLTEHPKVEEVFYPGISAQPQKIDNGTVLMFNLKDKESGVESIIDRLKLFTLSASLGSTESLAAPALYFYGGDLSPNKESKLVWTIALSGFQ